MMILFVYSLNFEDSLQQNINKHTSQEVDFDFESQMDPHNENVKSVNTRM